MNVKTEIEIKDEEVDLEDNSFEQIIPENGAVFILPNNIEELGKAVPIKCEPIDIEEDPLAEKEQSLIGVPDQGEQGSKVKSSGIAMNLEALYDLCSDDHQILAYLQETKLIKNEKKCNKCKKYCSIYKRGNRFFFRCPKCQKNFSSAPDGFSLHNSHVPYDKVLKMIMLFLANIKASQVVALLNISERTVISWYNFFREICVSEILNAKEKIGGVGKEVEFEESMFGKRKYNSGRIVKSQWVVGGIERGSGKSFLVAVVNRNSNTLMEIFQEYIKPGSTVITEKWRDYRDEIDLNHVTVNHSINFVDKTTDEHTNPMESEWGNIKARLPKGSHCKNHFLSYLCSYMWKKKNKNNKFENFIAAIVNQQNM